MLVIVLIIYMGMSQHNRESWLSDRLLLHCITMRYINSRHRTRGKCDVRCAHAKKAKLRARRRDRRLAGLEHSCFRRRPRRLSDSENDTLAIPTEYRHCHFFIRYSSLDYEIETYWLIHGLRLIHLFWGDCGYRGQLASLLA